MTLPILPDQPEQPTSSASTHTKPKPKKHQELTKALLFTVMLHAILAGGLIWYWQNHHQFDSSTKSTTTKASSSANTAVITPIIASQLPASTITTSASASVPASQPVTNSVSSTAQLTKNTHTNINQTSSSNIMSSMTLPVDRINANLLNILNAQQVIVHEAPVNQVLTSRDIPMASSKTANKNTTNLGNEVTNSDIANKNRTNPKNQSNSNLVKAQPTAPKTVTEKQAKQLSKELDMDNKELTDLIDQIKNDNKQKIEKHQQQNNPSYSEQISIQNASTPSN
ncbi:MULTISPECIES: hypothetical protein [unclassified Moraxella]|uniref:hypothetical protein n=1 Tax=unclassified Moraxella TaxID=2685852 RepID=UPI003AF53E74